MNTTMFYAFEKVLDSNPGVRTKITGKIFRSIQAHKQHERDRKIRRLNLAKGV